MSRPDLLRSKELNSDGSPASRRPTKDSTDGRTETQTRNQIPTHQPKFPSGDRVLVAMRTLSGGARVCLRVVTHQRAVRSPKRSFGQRKENQRIASSPESPLGVRAAMEELLGGGWRRRATFSASQGSRRLRTSAIRSGDASQSF
jgi:hypothetical protein